MDRKSIIILVVSFILLMLWYPLVVNKLYPPQPVSRGATNGPAGPLTNQAATAPNPPPPSLETAAPAPKPTIPNPAQPEQLLELTNINARYVFSTHGGGLKQVELLQYPESISVRGRKATQSKRVATLNDPSPMPALALLDGEAVQGDNVYQLSRAGNGVRAEKALTNGLSIVKEFQPLSNYLVSATVRLVNRSSNSLALPAQQWIVGTATPLGPDDNGQAVGIMWYNGDKTEDIGASYFSARGFMCMPRVPPEKYQGGAGNVAWVATHNQFFTLAAIPQKAGQSLVVRKENLAALPGQDERGAPSGSPAADGYTAAIIYPALTLAPSESQDRQFLLYAGPKEYRTLANIAGRLNNNQDLVMGYGGFFGFFAKALLLTMNWLHNALSFSYAWAIIAITIIIKLLFWPLTQASTRSMKRMQELQPQMKAIQEKYKDDPVKMNRKTMEFMKEHKVSPLGGCLPMLLQIPVFFGFYQMIQSAIELRGAGFLWIGDLSQPDTLFMIPGTNFPFNLLPLIMGATMLWQARLTPPSPGMDPTQAKIMRYMPLMFMVFLYNFSAGLTLYWTVQNLLTIAQTKLTKTTPAATPVPAAKGPVLTPPSKKRK
jgi:YidC/Oxa1 family membrane protein insertase